MYTFDKIEKHCTGSRGRDIYGKLYKPHLEDKMPIMVISPELGYVCEDEVPYAEYFASMGIAVYLFDVCGGGYKSRSEGKTTEMSILTNYQDVEAVVLEAGSWDFVDPEKVVLYGLSQGGLCAFLAAREIQDKLAALMLAYPGFAILEYTKSMHGDIENIPEVWNLNDWMDVSREYITDTLGMDAYEEFAKIKMPVLIMHGTRDAIFPLDFSKRAAEMFENVDLHIIEGANHSFTRRHLPVVLPIMMEHMKAQGVL